MLLVLSLLAWVCVALIVAVGVRRWFFAVPPDGSGGDREVRIAVVGKSKHLSFPKIKGRRMRRNWMGR
jgi:hypothetical protein